MSSESKALVAQWLRKAEMDWSSVLILSSHAQCPCSVVCFHCQQYVEKLVKALLTLHNIEAPRTHELRRLIQLVSPIVPSLNALADQAEH